MIVWLSRLIAILFLLPGFVNAQTGPAWQPSWKYVCGNGQTTNSPHYCEKHGGYLCEDNSHPRHLATCKNRGGPRHKTAAEKYLCSNRTVSGLTNGCNGADYQCRTGNKRKHKLSQCRKYGGPVFSVESTLNPVCGDGIINPGEQCDNGASNSDIAPDACRSDCRRAHCGDGVKDSREQCDEASDNNIENHCRINCTLPVCGDGIVDDQFNEQCDDANKNETDGCRSDCKRCLKANTNHNIESDTLLCRNSYSAADIGDEGVLIVKYPNVILDCNGATLRGDGRGTGIMVLRADGAQIRNCHVTGYENGIKVISSRGVVISAEGNPAYGNRHEVVKENSDVRIERTSMARHGMSRAARQTPGASAKSGSMTKRSSNTAGHLSRPTSKVSKEKVSGAGNKAVNVPIISYPRSGQRYNAPASIVVRLKSKIRKRVIYTLKLLPGHTVRTRSNSGIFRNISPGKYCVQAAWATTPAKTGSCVVFTVLGRIAKPYSGTDYAPAVKNKLPNQHHLPILK